MRVTFLTCVCQYACFAAHARVFISVYFYLHPQFSFYSFITLSAVVYNYNNNINIIIMLINTLKVRDGRSRVYKKYVYKCVISPFSHFYSLIKGRTQLYTSVSLHCPHVCSFTRPHSLSFNRPFSLFSTLFSL